MGKCGIFLDDIVILGRSFEDHMKNMEQVLSRFRDFKLKLKPSKCELLKRNIIFLGHKGSREGVSPNPVKVREVKEWPTPKNKTELESFLGLKNFYREHLDRFADTAACLYRLRGERLISKIKRSYNGGTTVSLSEGGWGICIGYGCFR